MIGIIKYTMKETNYIMKLDILKGVEVLLCVELWFLQLI